MALQILTVQTATAGGSVALTADEQLLGEICLNTRKTPADWLLGAVQRLLAGAGLTLDQLDAFGVVSGPGAFTGLRVGMATVKGLAFSADRPVVGVSTLECLALHAPFSHLPVCAMLDARKKEVYVATYVREEGGLHRLGDESVVAPDIFLDSCSVETLFVGNGSSVYRTLITRRLGRQAHFLSGLYDLPRAGLAAQLVLRDWHAGKAQSAEQLRPRYLRPSEAELNMPK